MKPHTCPLIRRRTLPAAIQSKSSVHASASVSHEDALESEPSLASHPAVGPASAWVTLHKWAMGTRPSLWFVMPVGCCCLPSCSVSLGPLHSPNPDKEKLDRNKKCQSSNRQFFIRIEIHSGGSSSDRGRSELFGVPHICGPLFPRLFRFRVVLAGPLPRVPDTSPKAFQRECMANSLYVKAR